MLVRAEVIVYHPVLHPAEPGSYPPTPPQLTATETFQSAMQQNNNNNNNTTQQQQHNNTPAPGSPRSGPSRRSRCSSGSARLVSSLPGCPAARRLFSLAGGGGGGGGGAGRLVGRIRAYVRPPGEPMQAATAGRSAETSTCSPLHERMM